MTFACCLIASLLSSGGTILSEEGTVEFHEMIASLRNADVVFIGENHGDPFAHAWELAIWRALAQDGRLLALEMFETDVQHLLDAFLADSISEAEFLEGARPWSNYETDYAPLVNHAKQAGLQVIAANVPRSHAATVAREGFAGVSSEAFFQSLDIDSSSTEYRNRFLAVMDAMGQQMHSMAMDPMNLYRAQLLKDAVMAFSIGHERVLFICGSFHSDYHSGIPDQIRSEASILTVKVLSRSDVPDPSMADFLITPCD
jgi:uncharacterized iron-regulated protein